MKHPPFITFANGSSAVFVEDDFESITHANVLGLKSRPYDGMLIVDADLLRYTVRGAKIRGGRGRFGGFNVFLNRNVYVDLDLKPATEQLSLEELKAAVLERLTDEDIEEFYEPSDGSFYALLDAASSFESV